MISVAQIRAARGLLGWSQGELADRAGLSRSAVARLELGEVEPREETVEKLHRALFRAGVRFTSDPKRGVEGVERRLGYGRARKEH